MVPRRRRRLRLPRSSLKPVQAVAMVENGLSLSPELLALVCASHSGEERHLAGVRRILAGAGLGSPTSRTPPIIRMTKRPGTRSSAPAAAGCRSPRTAPASTRACSPPARRTAGRRTAIANPRTRCSGPSPPSSSACAARSTPLRSTAAARRSTTCRSPAWPGLRCAGPGPGRLGARPRRRGHGVIPEMVGGRARGDRGHVRVPGLVARTAPSRCMPWACPTGGASR